ncbi:MAG: class I SAM-dependent methyltransferase [Sedimentisphaerales bacterium]|nr:class I SAM-dependent methyltransferase [Sedimentisphaerales bacterium]
MATTTLPGPALPETTPAVESVPLRVAVVMPSHNEGDRLAHTVRCLLAGGAGVVGEIVIVDDGSTDGSIDAIDPGPRLGNEVQFMRHGVVIRVVRFAERRGVAAARQYGGELAYRHGAAVVLFMDAHVFLNPVEGYRLAQLADQYGAVVQAGCRSWAITSTWTRYGGRLGLNFDRILGVSYSGDRPTEEIGRVGACIGACYAVSRAAWEAMGGWLSNGGLWGFNEQLLSLKAFFCGVPLYVHRDIAAMHYFKKKTEGCAASRADVWKARYAVLAVTFGQEAFDHVWLPRLKRKFWSPEIKAFLASDGLRAEHEAFQRLKQRTDEECFEVLLPWLRRWEHSPIPRQSQIRSEIEEALAVVQPLQPSTFLEIGSANGGSAWLYAGACRPGAHLILVDRCARAHRDHLQTTIAALEAEGRRVTLVRGNSRDPEIVETVQKAVGKKKVDALHIDCDHTMPAVQDDWNNYSPLVRPGGIILMHDIGTRGRECCQVPEFWADVRRDKRVAEIRHGRDKGIGVIYVPRR